MDAKDVILNRRSIREFTDQPVPDTLIHDLLRAAMAAPSAGNEQPWHFIVIEDRQILDAIPLFHPYSHMLHQVSAAILVCGDLKLETHKGSWVLDCSAATQNIMLMASEMGLGSVWVGIYPDENRILNIRKLLNLPEHIIPLSLVPIGYPAEKKEPSNRYNISRIRYNRWE